MRRYLLADDIQKIVDADWPHQNNIVSHGVERGIKIALGLQVFLKCTIFVVEIDRFLYIAHDCRKFAVVAYHAGKGSGGDQEPQPQRFGVIYTMREITTSSHRLNLHQGTYLKGLSFLVGQPFSFIHS